ncbi:hypothetical protein [Hamadaea tsunoensis]|uniref:hypothetical protein n=1 Tax=Hamadaea tsunoensis TaxID=53368 RepID=UPI0012FA3F7B|nr:hypothetical protein [Hamadaea tsunoensis]
MPPESAVVVLARELLHRHSVSVGGLCGECGLAVPCPPARHALEVCEQVGHHPAAQHPAGQYPAGQQPEEQQPVAQERSVPSPLPSSTPPILGLAEGF